MQCHNALQLTWCGKIFFDFWALERNIDCVMCNCQGKRQGSSLEFWTELETDCLVWILIDNLLFHVCGVTVSNLEVELSCHFLITSTYWLLQVYTCGFILKWPICNCTEGVSVFSVTLETVMFCLVYLCFASFYS